MGDENKKDNIDDLNKLLDEKNIQIANLTQDLLEERQINNKTKDYLLVLESKVVEFDKQKEIINSLNSQISQLKNDITTKDNEINSLKQELDSSKLTEEYIMKILDLRRDMDKI